MGDNRALKREFGADLTFWVASTRSYVMPARNAGGGRDEVRRRIEISLPGEDMCSTRCTTSRPMCPGATC